MNEQDISEILIKRGNKLLARPFEQIQFTSNAQADALLNDLDHYPHAFVLACVMDRRIKAEKAWLIPHVFSMRLGSFEFPDLERLSEERVRELFAEPQPLHWLREVMALNFYRAVQRIARDYLGDVCGIWAGTPPSATIVRRFLEFDGVGPKIATMAANILVRDFKIPVSDKISIDISPDVQVRRAFTRLGLIREGASNEEIIYRAREMNPTYPGIFDLSAWEIGRNWCRPRLTECELCYMNTCCQTASR